MDGKPCAAYVKKGCESMLVNTISFSLLTIILRGFWVFLCVCAFFFFGGTRV
jgi:hypothetical protein